MSDRKPTSVVLPAVVAALVLLGAYVGVYYATVTSGVAYEGNLDSPNYGEPIEVYEYYPRLAAEYYVDTDGTSTENRSHIVWRGFFAPANWLDRRIRPHVWGIKK